MKILRLLPFMFIFVFSACTGEKEVPKPTKEFTNNLKAMACTLVDAPVSDIASILNSYMGCQYPCNLAPTVVFSTQTFRIKHWNWTPPATIYASELEQMAITAAAVASTLNTGCSTTQCFRYNFRYVAGSPNSLYVDITPYCYTPIID